MLKVDGEVNCPAEFDFEQLRAFSADQQLHDVSQVDPQRQGDAIRLSGLLAHVQVRPAARYIGLHSSKDNFHASIPLDPVRGRALLIYCLNGEPLEARAGGPVRFFIPDHAACHTDEIDECANVKFVDHIELTVDRGFDNRPEDDESHERLHREQGGC